MKPEHASELIDALVTHYGKDIPAEQRALFIDKLGPYNAQLAFRASERCAEIETYFPSWGRLHGYLSAEVAEARRLEEERKRETYKRQPHAPPGYGKAAHAAVMRIMAGESDSETELHALHQQFGCPREGCSMRHPWQDRRAGND